MKRRHRSTGSILIQFVLIFPLFLALLFYFLWHSYIYNASSSFESTVATALYLAVTRGDSDFFGRDLVSVIGEIKNDNITQETQKLFSHSNDSGTTNWNKALNYYENTSLKDLKKSNNIDISKFDDLPVSYLLALLYINNGLYETVGSTVRFPCDANEPGCISCVFKNPYDLEAPEYAWPEDLHGNLNPRRIAIECEFQPHTFLATPIFSMLNTAGINATQNFLKFVIRKSI